MPHNNGFTRRLARSSAADKTRALSQQATARKLGSTEAAPQIGVGLADGQVVITFPAAVTHARFSPANARTFAAALVEQADKADPALSAAHFESAQERMHAAAQLPAEKE